MQDNKCPYCESLRSHHEIRDGEVIVSYKCRSCGKLFNEYNVKNYNTHNADTRDRRDTSDYYSDNINDTEEEYSYNDVDYNMSNDNDEAPLQAHSNELFSSSIKYNDEFLKYLNSVISDSLNIDNLFMSEIKTLTLYSPNMLASAVSAGFILRLPVECAVAHFVVAVGYGYEKANGSFKLMLSKEKRQIHEEHVKITRYVSHLIDRYAGTEVSDKFLREMLR